jgi:hypothetical protein
MIKALSSLTSIVFPVVEVKDTFPVNILAKTDRIEINGKVLINRGDLLSSFDFTTVNQIETRYVYQDLESFVMRHLNSRDGKILIDSKFNVYVTKGKVNINLYTDNIKAEDDFFILGERSPHYFDKPIFKKDTDKYLLVANELNTNTFLLLGYLDTQIVDQTGVI